MVFGIYRNTDFAAIVIGHRLLAIKQVMFFCNSQSYSIALRRSYLNIETADFSQALDSHSALISKEGFYSLPLTPKSS